MAPFLIYLLHGQLKYTSCADLSHVASSLEYLLERARFMAFRTTGTTLVVCDTSLRQCGGHSRDHLSFYCSEAKIFPAF